MKNDNQKSAIGKYTGIGVQMLLTIIVFAWLGSKLDDYLKTKQPYMTLAGMLFGVVGSIINLIRQINKDNEGK